MGIKPIEPVEILAKLVVTAEACVRKESWRSASTLTDKANTLSSKKSVTANRTKAGSVASMRQRIAALYQQLDAEAERRLEASRECYEQKNYAEALAGYRSVVYCFGRRPRADEARKALTDAAADPERKQMIDQIKAKEMEEAIAELIERARASRGCGSCPKCREAARAAGAKATSPEAKAQSRVDKIKALTVEGQAKVCAELARLAKLFPKFSEGRRAAEDLATLKADKGFQAALDRHRGERDARGLLSLAKAYRGIGKSDRAATYCKKVLDQFPGTPAAADAQEMLDDIEAAAP